MIRFCSLYSGSSGNCIFVGTERTKLLVDAGVSGSRISGALSEIHERPNDIQGILITHEHSDHIRGAGIYSRKYHVPIYATAKTWQAMEQAVAPIQQKNRRMIPENGSGYVRGQFVIGDISVVCYSIPHDAADPVAYTFYADQKKISVATDIGHMTEGIRSNLLGSDLALIESNHDIEMLKYGSYPYYLKKRILSDVGHMSNDSAADIVTQMALSGTKRFFLGHLSKENNDPELALKTACSMLKERGLIVGRDLYMAVAAREHYSEVITL